MLAGSNLLQFRQLLSNLFIVPDYCFRRAEDRLQEPDRPVQQPQPLSAAGVLLARGEARLMA